jgi:hypothetical protein
VYRLTTGAGREDQDAADGFSQIETCLRLPLVNGSRFQPLQRCQFLGPFPVGPIVGGDRNGNGFVCLKEVDSMLIAIDDTANPNADRN